MMVVALGSCRTPAGRTPGEVIGHSTITTKVKAKLFDDNILRGVGISVDTFGGYVTLTGDKDVFQVVNMGSTARSTSIGHLPLFYVWPQIKHLGANWFPVPFY